MHELAAVPSGFDQLVQQQFGCFANTNHCGCRRTRYSATAAKVRILYGGSGTALAHKLDEPFKTRHDVKGFQELLLFWLLQVDAHIDWRDEVGGERYGYYHRARQRA